MNITQREKEWSCCSVGRSYYLLFVYIHTFIEYARRQQLTSFVNTGNTFRSQTVSMCHVRFRLALAIFQTLK